MEIWKSIPGYEDRYEVSDKGRVKSTIFKKTRIMKQTIQILNRGTYRQPRVMLRSEAGKPKYWTVAHLVLLAFVGPRPNGLIVCHDDDDPEHNYLCNLKYDTRRANMRDAFKNGSYAEQFDLFT